MADGKMYSSQVDDCPRCESSDIILFSLLGGKETFFNVLCLTCGKESQIFLYETEAVEVWNNLPSEMLTQKEIQEHITKFSTVRERISQHLDHN